jgi:hypothetical protein
MGSSNTSEPAAKIVRGCDGTLGVMKRPRVSGVSANRSNLRCEGKRSEVEFCDGEYVLPYKIGS